MSWCWDVRLYRHQHHISPGFPWLAGVAAETCSAAFGVAARRRRRKMMRMQSSMTVFLIFEGLCHLEDLLLWQIAIKKPVVDGVVEGAPVGGIWLVERDRVVTNKTWFQWNLQLRPKIRSFQLKAFEVVPGLVKAMKKDVDVGTFFRWNVPTSFSLLSCQMRSGNPCFSNGELYSPLAVAARADFRPDPPCSWLSWRARLQWWRSLKWCTPGWNRWRNPKFYTASRWRHMQAPGIPG